MHHAKTLFEHHPVYLWWQNYLRFYFLISKMMQWSSYILNQGVRWYTYYLSISFGLHYLYSPLKKGVKRLCSPLKPEVNRANLFLNRFTWLYHLQLSLNIPISPTNFIKKPNLLDVNSANFSADPYYNIITGSWIKALVFGINATYFQSTSKFPIDVPCRAIFLPCVKYFHSLDTGKVGVGESTATT